MIRKLAEKKIEFNIKEVFKVFFYIILILSLLYILFLTLNIFTIILKLQNFSLLPLSLSLSKITNLEYYNNILLNANIEALKSFASIFTPFLALVTLWQGYDKFLEDKKQQEIIRKDKQFIEIIKNLSADNMSLKISSINSLPIFSTINEPIYDRFISKEQYYNWLRNNCPYIFETIETLITTLILAENVNSNDRDIISKNCINALNIINNNTQCHSIIEKMWPEEGIETEYYNAIELNNKNLKNTNLDNIKLNGVECITTNFTNSHIDFGNFQNCCMSRANFSKAQLTNTYFSSCNMNLTNFDNTSLTGTSIYNIDIDNKKTKMYALSFIDTKLNNASFGNIKFCNCKFKNINFENCFLSNIEFENCELENVNFENAKLDKETYNSHKKNLFKDYCYAPKTYTSKHFDSSYKIKYGVLQKENTK